MLYEISISLGSFVDKDIFLSNFKNRDFFSGETGASGSQVTEKYYVTGCRRQITPVEISIKHKLKCLFNG